MSGRHMCIITLASLQVVTCRWTTALGGCSHFSLIPTVITKVNAASYKWEATEIY